MRRSADFHLLYRRLAVCGPLKFSKCPPSPRTSPITNPRNSRLKICATTRLRATRFVGYSSTMFPAEPNPRIERVRFELGASGVKPEQARPLRSGTHTRGYLPHVKREAPATSSRFASRIRSPGSSGQDSGGAWGAPHALPRTAGGRQEARHTRACASTLQEIERDYFRKLRDTWTKAAGNAGCGGLTLRG